MTHGPTRIPSKGACIYCGERDSKLTDEHVLPLSLGGVHILEQASCLRCADITKKFEQDVARELWGDARISYGAPSRRKKKRPTHILLHDLENSRRSARVPYSDYAPPLVFYKMRQAGILAGWPETVDLSSAWEFVAVTDDKKAKEFEKKFGFKMPARFRNVPQSFARTLIKVGYCHVLTELETDEFRQLCVPYILGTKANTSFIIGGDFQIPQPDVDHGYVLSTRLVGDLHKMAIIAEIRIFANVHSPRYHVVVGEVSGHSQVTKVLDKLSVQVPPQIKLLHDGGAKEHWCPNGWPLPHWDNAFQ